MRRTSPVFLALLTTAAVAIGGPVRADENEEVLKETEVFAIMRGGALYDNWMAVLEADEPETTHPAYPAVGKQKGAATWRCKECHGWDYKGAAGAYGSGSHYTGIKGIRDYVGRDVGEIVAIIRDDTHRFDEAMIPKSAAEKLAMFVSRGQIDMDLYIDRKTKKVRGDPNRGARFFQTICAVCHGFDGKAINFKDEAKPEFIGTIARENPWETLHKIRNGQPGVAMVGLAALPIEDQVDLLAYAQTLPEK